MSSCPFAWFSCSTYTSQHASGSCRPYVKLPNKMCRRHMTVISAARQKMVNIVGLLWRWVLGANPMVTSRTTSPRL